MSTIAARIERIPFNPFDWQLLPIGEPGYALVGFDVAVGAFVLPILRTAWSLSSSAWSVPAPLSSAG